MKRERRRRWSVMLPCAVAVAFAFAVVGGARAEDLTAARACASIADKAARLACYDAAFASIAVPGASAAAAAPSAASTAPRAAAAAVPATAQFGDNGQLRPQDRSGLPKKQDFKVQSVAPVGRNLYRLTMDNGQVWETKQADWTLDFKSGDTVTISRMLFDSYQISLAGRGSSVSVKRLQ